MNHFEIFVVALANAIMPWVTLWVIAQFFLRAGKRQLQAIVDLTAQVVAFKNPWAAQMYGRIKAEQEAESLKQMQAEHMMTNKDTDSEMLHDEEASYL